MKILVNNKNFNKKYTYQVNNQQIKNKKEINKMMLYIKIQLILRKKKLYC